MVWIVYISNNVSVGAPEAAIRKKEKKKKKKVMLNILFGKKSEVRRGQGLNTFTDFVMLALM